MSEQGHLTRRELIRISATAVLAVGGAERGIAGERTLKFFAPEEFAMLDELTELIIPADDHSPGARGAEVAAYLDGRLAKSVDEESKNQWHEGLRRVDALAREMHGMLFLQAAPEQRVAVLSRISQNEKDPQTPDEKFFVELKYSTAKAYYSSKIGIHQDMEYTGNVFLPEFVGYEVK